MGHDISLELRQHNLMTKIMLKKEEEVIEHLNQNKFDVTEPINQIGDTILHYAAYRSLKILMQFLLEKEADCYQPNHRGLTPIDVATPEIREWLIRKEIEVRNQAEDKPPDSKGENIVQSTVIRRKGTEQSVKYSP